ncbi:asc-type amino acid transporter 1 isoform X2 [Haemorhous mexicanus]|uniref:asc-type amino acid transporter 1 isoform X2 n=1 Tax=Haemorhous mexicanus TaxID=30427 RepID=UPI0028BDD0F8|nr:asc-type amino acid transporter 1 isoform X2 [Haemorhous mexicanus]
MAGGEQRLPGGPERVALKKEIGLVSACAIIIGNIIGSGIFISPKGVLEHAGSVGLALIIWVLGGGVAALGSLCYAELGVTIPKSGGDYSYVTEIFGGLAGFLLLWSAVLIMYPTSLAVIALTFSNYVLQPVFPNCIPPYNASRILSMVCLLLLTWVNSSSVRWATRIQDIFTAGKLLALTLIIVVGFIQIFKGNYKELTPSNAFRFWMTPSVGHLALAFLQGSFAFSGWNFLNYVTEELVDPRRNLPRAIFISIPLVTFVYTFTNIAYFTAMSPQELLSSNAVAVAVFLWCSGRPLAKSAGHDPRQELHTHPCPPHLCKLPSLLCQLLLETLNHGECLATLIIMLVGDTYTLINYVSFINYLCYGVTIIGLIVLRWKKPKIFRPIKVNLLIPITYLAFWAFLLVFSLYSEPVVCGVGLIIILTGVPVFFLGVYWRNKPKSVNRLIESLTCWGQKLCFVVYPQCGSAEEEHSHSSSSHSWRLVSDTAVRK